MRQGVLTAMIIFFSLFIVIVIFISSLVTKPIRLLQIKMSTLVRNNMLTHIPEHPYAGETLSLTRSFNNMIAEMKELIARLKMEEREKEALNYQMLLSQMNPHFLLNTLNTIKWIAMEREVDEVVHICVNLGKLLERSLRHDV